MQKFCQNKAVSSIKDFFVKFIFCLIFKRTEKLKRILQLWDRGEGVISMHLFHNIHSAEAFIREGAMIEAIGFSTL